ncbi:MAG: amino acid adenylation domain-containing protein [Bacteroidota bacterium]
MTKDRQHQIALEYWTNKLSSIESVDMVPGDAIDHTGLGGRVVEEVQHVFDDGLKQKLNAVSNGNVASQSVLAITALQIVLSKYNVDLPLIATPPVSLGNTPENNGQPLFINIKPEENATLRSVMDLVKKQLLEGIKHQDYSYEKLARTLAANQSFDQEDALQVVFIHEKGSLKDGFDTSGFDLIFTLHEDCGSFSLVYNKSVFTTDFAAQLVRHYGIALSQLLTNADALLHGVQLLSEADQKELVRDFNQTENEREYRLSLVELFEEQVIKTPELKAVIHNDQSLTYDELNAHANRVAHYLTDEAGLQKGQRVAIQLDKSERLMTAIFGILKAGGNYVPIDPKLPELRKQNILDDCQAKLVITEQKYKDLPISSPLFLVEEILAANLSATNPSMAIKPEDICYTLYTSGTTGTPKGVEISHQAVVNLSNWLSDLVYADLKEPAVALLTASISFDASVKQLFAPFLNGACLVTLNEEQRNDITAYIHALKHYKVNVLDITPVFLNEVISTLEEEQATLDIDNVMVGGEILTPEITQRFHNIFEPSNRLVNVYGVTEATVDSTFEIIEANRPTRSIGRPIYNTGIGIIDKQGQLAPKGVWGEIAISGVGLAKGYLNLEELTSSKFIANPYDDLIGDRLYLTGDIGRWRMDGQLEFLGRRDNQVKLRGYRIELSEIDNTLSTHDSIKKAAHLVREVNGDKHIVSYYTGEQAIEKNTLKEFLEARLPRYMVPTHFVWLPKFPLTSNGKLDTKKLKGLDPDGVGNESYQAPRNEIEKQIAIIWQEVLGRERIGINDNFLELGGHSLKAIRIVSRMHKEIQFKIDLNDIFTYPTIAELSNLKSNSVGDLQEYEPIPQAEPSEQYIASHAQNRLWILNELQDLKHTYNLFESRQIKGQVDIKRLESALIYLIDRHEILRTTFHQENGKLYQKIKDNAEKVGFRLKFTDLNSDVDDASIDAQEIIDQENSTIFNLSTGPLMTAHLVKINSDKFTFIWVLHHIIVDGWSMQLLLNELFQAYDHRLKDQSLSLPRLSIQYKDYSEWHWKKYQEDKENPSRLFWIDQFSDEIPVLDLPTDRSRPPVKTYNGGVVKKGFKENIENRLLNLERELGLTRSMLFQGLVKLLFFRYTGNTDIVIGMPSAGREHPDLEDQVGFYVNMLPLRSRLKPKMSFREFISGVRLEQLEVFKHGMYPFDMIVEDLDVPKDLSRHPIFDIVVVDQTFEDKLQESQGNTEDFTMDSGETSKYDLSFVFTKENGSSICLIEYNSDIFDSLRVARMATHIERLLESILDNPDLSMTEVELLTREENEEITNYSIGESSEIPSGTLAQFFEKQVELNPDSLAIVSGEERLTYHELNERSNQLAWWMINQKNLKPQEVVAVIAGRSSELIIAILGILKCGAIYLPIDHEYPDDRIKYMLDDADVKLILSNSIEKDFDSDLENVDLKELDKITLDEDSRNPEIPNNHNDLAYIVYTSGSTGQPKGVMIGHHGVVNLYKWHSDEFDIDHTSRSTMYVGVGFDASAWEIWPYLLSGACIYPVNGEERLSTEFWRELVRKERITHSLLPTVMCDEVLGIEGLSFEHDVKVFTGGDKLNQNNKTSIAIFNDYGPAEATVCTSSGPVEKQGKVSIGRPITNFRVAILDDFGHLQPIGIPGELHIGGAGLAKGYLNRPALTNEKFVELNVFDETEERFYKTGDICSWAWDGKMMFHGRKDRQVQLRGHRIELSEIEKYLIQYDGVSNAHLVAYDEGNDKYLAAYYVSEKGNIDNQLKEFLNEQVPYYMVPSHFCNLDSLPLNKNGKIDETRLPKAESRKAKSDYLAPKSALEVGIVEVWQEILGYERIGVTDSFLELGGHSLKAMRILSQMRKDLGVKADLRDLFEYPTIRELASKLEGTQSSDQIEIPKAEAREFYPVSASQKGLWLIDQQSKWQHAYNIPEVYHLDSTLDIEVLRVASIYLVNRHESLRTTFHLQDDEVVQKVHTDADAIGFSLVHTELEAGQQEEAKSLVQADQQQAFDLSKGPLLSIHVISLGEADHLVSLVIHHIISDGWSMNVLRKELLNIYEALANQSEPELDALTVQYKDYAVWQYEELSSGKLKEAEAYWLNIFKEGPPALQLPADRPRPVNKTYAGRTVGSIVDQGAFKQLEQINQQTGLSLFISLLGMVKLLLHKYSGQKDITLGTVTAGRDHHALEHQIGFYLNTLALRTEIDTKERFEDYLLRLKQENLEAFEHRAYPFHQLVEQSTSTTETSRHPLFDVMVMLDNVEDLGGGLSEERNSESGVNVGAYTVESTVSKFDLTFHFQVLEEQLYLGITYNTDLFDRWRIEQMINHLNTLILTATDRPQSTIEDIDIITSEERHKLLSLSQGPKETPKWEGTVQRAFAEVVERVPDNTALIGKGNSLTYHELNNESNRLAHRLIEDGIKPNDAVGILLGRSERQVVAMLGILKSGGCYVPIDSSLPQERVAFMISDAAVKKVVTSDEHTSKLDPSLVMLDQQNGGDLSPNPQITDQADQAYILYTSGSTGQPKGVAIRHDAVLNLCQWLTELIYGRHDAPLTALLTASISFDASVQQLFTPLLNGGTLVLASEESKKDTALYWLALEEFKVDVLDITPSFLDVLLSAKPSNGKLQLKHVLVGGEALQSTTAVAFQQKLPNTQLINVYGVTESTVDSTYGIVNDTWTSGEIGTPIPNTGVYILSDSKELQPVGVWGEMAIAGVGVGKGYINRPELTSEKFIANPFGDGRLYLTGDIGRWTKEGRIAYQGRKDNQVKLRGYRIELGEIESCLNNLVEIRGVAVLIRNEELVCYYAAETVLNIDNLKEALADRLPHYMVPSHYVNMDELPLNKNGKVDRGKLSEIEFDITRDYQSPESELEHQLVAIWQGILGQEKIGATDNFFELGGHSLKAMRIVSQIQKVLGIQITLRDLFEYPTIGELAITLEGNESGEQTEIPLATSREFYPASVAQKGLWLIDQQTEGHHVYNIPEVYHLGSDLDIEALRKAVVYLVDRHEALRTTFHLQDNEVVQKVHQSAEAIGFSLNYTILEVDQQEEADSLLEANLQQSFDMEQGPLLNIQLISVGKAQHIVSLVIHHIISDGWSMNVLRKELLAIYEAFAQGVEPKLPNLPVQYKDYAAWQHQELAEGKLKRAEAFWLKMFEEAPPVLQLPTDRSRPVRKTYTGRTIGSTVDQQSFTALKRLNQQTGASLFISLMGLVKLLLHKYTGQKDITLGTVTAGRDHHTLEHQIGFYLNTLALRTEIDTQESFEQYLLRLKGENLEAYDHRQYPFHYLVERSGVYTEASRHPLFDVMVMLQNMEDLGGDLSEDIGSEANGDPDSHEAASTVSKFDMTFHFHVEGGQLRLGITYNTDLFDSWRIEKMLSHLNTLIVEVTGKPHAAIQTLSFTTQEERDQLLALSQGTTVAPKWQDTIQSVFESAVEQVPDNVALIGSNGTLTYNELNNQANRLAHQLIDAGIQADDAVGIMLDKGERQLVAILGVLKSGGCYVPIDPNLPDERIGFMIADAAVKKIVTSVSHASKIDASLVVIDNPAGDDTRYDNPKLENKGDQAYILYTSGTTGKPKGVAIRHNAVLNLSQWLTELIYQVDGKPLTTLLTASISFDASVKQLYAPLFNQGKLIISTDDDKQNIQDYIDLLERHQIEVMDITPSYLNALLTELPDNHQLSLKYILVGGESLQTSTTVAFKAKLPHTKLINVYGVTESTVDSTFSVVDDNWISGEIGTPIPNTGVYIISDEGEMQPLGVWGEIAISGIGVGKGYINRPELTKEKFVDNPFGEGLLYKTGDIGRWTMSGKIEYQGRKDHQVKLRGYRIELGEIEACLNSLEQLDTAAVIIQNEELVCYYTAHRDVEVASLKEALASKLPSYMIPLHYVALEELPLNKNGKVDRTKLSTIKHDIRGDYKAPESQLEHQLVAIWQEILDQEGIGVTDNFFELGGHSLNGIRLISRVRKVLHKKIALNDLFDYPTIAQQAVLIEGKPTEILESIKSAEMMEFYPVSHAQRRLWVLDQLEDIGHAYNIPDIHYLNSNIDKSLLEEALRYIIDRHEIFRTTFVTIDGQPYQRILPSVNQVNFELTFDDLTHHPNQNALLDDLIAEEVSKVFSLSNDPLVSARLIKRDEEAYTFIWVMHHIIADGWSVRILHDELLHVYSLLQDGKPLELPVLSIQYKDYAVWQQNELGKGVLSSSRSFWLDQFADVNPVLNLPTDHPRPAVKTYRGQAFSGVLSQKASLALERLKKTQRLTNSMIFQGLVKLLCYKYSGQTDIVIGMPMAGRDHKDLENQIGFYVNMLALRSRLDEGMSFASYIEMIRKEQLQAFDHRMYPFDLLVEELDLGRETSRHPLFDMLVVDQNLYDASTATAVEPSADQNHAAGSGTSKYDISFIFSATRDDITYHLEYNTDIFEEARIARMIGHLEQILIEAVDDPTVSLKDLNCLTRPEIDQLDAFSKGASCDYPNKTLHSLFEACVPEHAHEPAIKTGLATLTYTALDQKANQLAWHLLDEHGLKKGDVVGVMMERCNEWAVALLGILKAGGVYLPIDPDYPKGRIDYMLEDAKVDLIIVDKTYEKLGGADIINICEQVFLSGKQGSPNIDVSPDHLAYIIYTSGSTGKPKGVMVEHKNVVNLCYWHNTQFKVNEDSKATLYAGIGFDASVWELWPYLLKGACLFAMNGDDRIDPSRWVDFANQEHITHAFLPTVMCEQLMPHTHRLSNKEILILTGGDRLGQIRDSCLNIVNNYGPTETTVVATSGLQAPDEPVHIGKPIHNTEIYILDEYGKQVPIGVPGELYIGGAGITRGYINLLEQTDRHFVNHIVEEGQKIYRTGDICSWSVSGNIMFHGRKDRQVQIRGYRVELQEIEAALQNISGLDQTFVTDFTINDQQVLTAYYTSNEEYNPEVLREQLSQSLPKYMVPDYFVHLDAMPLNQNGKVDQHALPAPASEEVATTYYHPPVDTIQKRLVNLWQQVLGQQHIGIKNNFFDLGGHSIKAIKTVSLIKKELDVDIPIRAIYDHPTIEALGSLIKKNGQHNSLLVQLSAESDTGNDLFMIPPALGTAMVFDRLAGHLADQFNCYGLQYPGFDHEATMITSIESLADRLTTEILEKSGKPEVALLGFSMGALVAFEICKRLEEKGKEVTLMLLDRDTKDSAKTVPESISSSDVSTMLDKELGDLKGALSGEDYDRVKVLFKNNYDAVMAYKTSDQVKAHIIAIEAEFRPEARDMSGWKKHTNGRLIQSIAQGDHYSILSSEHVERLGELIKSTFNELIDSEQFIED